MKILLVVLSVLVLGIAVTGCGGGDKGADPLHTSLSVTGVAATGEPYNNTGHDSDDDDKTAPYDDANNDSVAQYGHAAGQADVTAVTALLKRYYDAGAAVNGAAGCSMLVRTYAGALAEDYGREPGPAYLHGGKTCVAVMDKLFAHDSRLLVVEASGLRVTTVRLEGDRGLAVLRLRGVPYERQMPVQRERGTWKIVALLDSELP